MSTEVIAPEVATREFERFAKAWGLDIDVSTMEEEDRQSFQGLERRITRAIVDGRFVVSDGEEVTYTLIDSKVDGVESLTFKIPTGGAVLAWDKFKDRQNIHKLNAYMGSMTGQNPTVFVKMDGRDLKVAQAVAQLFLGS